MYQPLLITALLFSISTFAANSKNEIPQIFADYIKQRDEFFKSDINKKNAKDKILTHLKFADSKYEAIKKIETANDETVLTEEGNQIAYEIELLGPVKTLVNSKISAQDCESSKHNNLMNSNEKKDTDKIGQIIEKICK